MSDSTHPNRDGHATSHATGREDAAASSPAGADPLPHPEHEMTPPAEPMAPTTPDDPGDEPPTTAPAGPDLDVDDDSATLAPDDAEAVNTSGADTFEQIVEGLDLTDAAASNNPDAAAAGADSTAETTHPDTALAAERLADLQRLQAEYVNYKKRVDRDRAGVQQRAVADVLETLLPVLDDIHAAREHGDLTDGPFAAIAEKLETTLGKFGLERFGAVGEEFDPMQHEALMHAPWPADGSIPKPEGGATTVVMVLQPGYRAGERVVRPARVSVADPE